MYARGWTPESDVSLGFPDLWSATQFVACSPHQPSVVDTTTVAAGGTAVRWVAAGKARAAVEETGQAILRVVEERGSAVEERTNTVVKAME